MYSALLPLVESSPLESDTTVAVVVLLIAITGILVVAPMVRRQAAFITVAIGVVLLWVLMAFIPIDYWVAWVEWVRSHWFAPLLLIAALAIGAVFWKDKD